VSGGGGVTYTYFPTRGYEAKYGIFGASAYPSCWALSSLPPEGVSSGKLPCRLGHPMDNKLVAQHIAEIQKLPPVEAYIALNTLIGNLRSGLRFSSLGDLGFIDDSAKTALERDLETIGILGAARILVSRLP
jgi:hypothetical protein